MKKLQNVFYKSQVLECICRKNIYFDALFLSRDDTNAVDPRFYSSKISIRGNHTSQNELAFYFSPFGETDSTILTLVEHISSNRNDFHIGFSDTGINQQPPALDVNGSYYTPQSNSFYEVFFGLDAHQLWSLTVEDRLLTEKETESSISSAKQTLYS